MAGTQLCLKEINLRKRLAAGLRGRLSEELFQQLRAPSGGTLDVLSET